MESEIYFSIQQKKMFLFLKKNKQGKYWIPTLYPLNEANFLWIPVAKCISKADWVEYLIRFLKRFWPLKFFVLMPEWEPQGDKFRKDTLRLFLKLQFRWAPLLINFRTLRLVDSQMKSGPNIASSSHFSLAAKTS